MRHNDRIPLKRGRFGRFEGVFCLNYSKPILDNIMCNRVFYTGESAAYWLCCSGNARTGGAWSWVDWMVHDKKGEAWVRVTVVVSAIAFAATAAAAEPTSIWAEASRAYDLDPLALYAVALQESRTLRPDGVARPWPWTLHSSRDGAQRFESLAEARLALEALLGDGERNIDIGLMQVNWAANGYRVQHPAELLDPHRNVLVGAAILHDALQASDGNLARALGAYHHHPDTARGRRYSEEVRRRLEHLQALPGLARALADGPQAQGPSAP